MKKRIFICSAAIGCLLLLNGCTSDKPNKQESLPFETSNGTQTATYGRTLAFCNKMAKLSPKIKFQRIGQSSQGYRIPMLIIDNNKHFNPDKVRKSGNIVLLIQANVHAGEPDGNDAGMLLIKEMVERDSFPKNITVLFLPVVNPDGLNRFGAYNRINQNGPEKMGWRTNAQHLNLNRDFIKAETPEILAWLKIFDLWQPDFTIDIHVTDGADYQYVLTYLVETLGNMDEHQTNWLEAYIKDVTQTVANNGIMAFPYTMFKKWHDPRSGLYLRPSSPMLSTGYIAMRNRPGILLESHSLKPFKQRVEAIYTFLKETVLYLEKEHNSLAKLNQQSDILASKLFEENSKIPLEFTVTDKCDTVDFLGVEYDVVKSDLTGGDWFRYNSEQPVSYRLPMYRNVIPSAEAEIPAAYIIGPEWNFIKRKLDAHGIKYSKIKSNAKIEAITYLMNDPTWSSTPIEGRFMLTHVELSKVEKKHNLMRETLIIPTNQPLSKIIVSMFDPQSPVSFLKTGFFNSVFEQSEYFETYKMEEIARSMLDTIPNLTERFDEWRNNRPQTPTSYEQLAWFYRQTPYFDCKKNVYPVLSIDKQTLDALTKKRKDLSRKKPAKAMKGNP